MDREQTSSSGERHSRNTPGSRSNSGATAQSENDDGNGRDAALLAQFAAAAGSGMEFDQPYSSMIPPNHFPPPAPDFYPPYFHHDNIAHPQLPPLSSLDFPWHQLPPQPPPPTPLAHQHRSHYHPQQEMPYIDPQYGSLSSHSVGTSSDPGRVLQSQPQASSSHTSSSPEVEQTEAERAAMSDEKRRRNTAASARFRIKKKQKTINLERSVSDLTGRAEELEREVTDLRRENGWLKEIVMLKGTGFASANLSHRLASSQAANTATASHGSDGPSHSGSGYQADDVSESSSSSDEERDKRKKKGKGTKSGRG